MPRYPQPGDLAVSGIARFVRSFIANSTGTFVWVGIIYIDDSRYDQPPAEAVPGSFNELALGFWTLTPIAEGEQILVNIVSAPFGVAPTGAVPADDLECSAPMVAKLLESAGLHAHAAFLKRLPELYANIWDLDLNEEFLPRK